MIDRIGDGWCDAHHRDFPQPFDAGAVELEVRLVDELHLDAADISVYWHKVFGKVGIEETAVPRIDLAGFVQRRPDAPHHAASDLTGRSTRTDDPPTVHDADHARYSHLMCGRLDAHLHEMRAVAEGNEFRVDWTRKR